MGLDFKVNSVESNTSFEKEGFNQYVPQTGHGAPKSPEQAEPGVKPAPESLFSATDIKNLLCRALAVVVARDAAVPLANRTDFLQRIVTEAQKLALREFVIYVQQTINDLKQAGRIGAESYELLAPFLRMGRKVQPDHELQPTDLDPELAELAELIHGKNVDIIHNLA
jgi:hypothetical protein